MADLTQIYGPLYGGMLMKQGMNTQNALAQNQSLQGTLGLLSDLAVRQQRQQEIEAGKAQGIQRQTWALGLLNQPDDVVQGTLGIPRMQAEGLLNMSGPDALVKIMQENAKQSETMRIINMLPPEERTAAVRSKAGIAPTFHMTDQGGTQAGLERNPVTGQVTPVYSAPKTAAPASRPAWLNADNTINEELYQREAGLRRAGAAQAPSININSPLLPGKDAQNKIDTGIMDTGRQLSGMALIEQGFRPEYQTLGAKWSNLRTGIKERMGLGVSSEDKQSLSDFTKYKTNSVNALNAYIKDMTGAALSEAEAQRLMQGMPVAGAGLFDGDSPTEFKAKLDAVHSQLRMAMARNTYMKRQGFALGSVPLDQMPQIMRKRADEIRSEIKAQKSNINDQELKDQTKRKLAEEFGLVYEQ